MTATRVYICVKINRHLDLVRRIMRNTFNQLAILGLVSMSFLMFRSMVRHTLSTEVPSYRARFVKQLTYMISNNTDYVLPMQALPYLTHNISNTTNIVLPTQALPNLTFLLPVVITAIPNPTSWSAQSYPTSPSVMQRLRRHEEAAKDVQIAYVVSLQGVTGANANNDGRLDNFSQAWREMCGSRIQFRVCPGVVDQRRGYGLTRSYVECFEQAMKDGQDYAVFLEDDARLKTSQFCDVSYRASIWSASTSDVLLIMLGGHAIKYGPIHRRGLRETTYSHGSYGFMVPFDTLKNLRDHFASDLLEKKQTLSPDISWYALASRMQKRIYTTSPSVVRHIAGYSNTWNISRGDIN
jgi:hypothetical protein